MKKKFWIWIAAFIALIAIFFVFAETFSGKLHIDPIVHLGFVEFRWYGIILAAAILTSYSIARKNSWKFGIAAETVDDYSFWVVLVSMLGARVYHVLFNLDFYLNNLSEIYKIWHGGISIYGAVLAGLAFTFFYCRKKAFKFEQLFDLVALSLPLGQAIGRLGNFVNQEAYGTVTDLPWKMYVVADRQFHHPTFLYEVVFDLILFCFLYRMVGKTKPAVLGLIYLGGYSFGRFFIEAIRIDSFFVAGFRVDQITAFLLIVISGVLILRKQSR